MKLKEYFGELKTPTAIAAEYIATAYFNEEIFKVERDDLQNYVRQCNINSYELVFHAINEIEARALSNIADIVRDYPILNVNWVNIRIDRAKIESDLRILLNIDMPSEDTSVEDAAIKDIERLKQMKMEQMAQKSREIDPMEQALRPYVLK